MTDTNYNIAIIGQTGVGKSSLINYLFGDKVAKSGVGRPVTTNGFHEINHKIKDMQVKIYDSWGLEVGKEEQWFKELNNELKNRGIDKPASDWFHSIFYCIAAAGGRIQDADCKIIKKLISEDYKVSVVLTKADSLTEDEEAEFIKVISNELGNNIAIIPVCSEHKKTRGGEIFPFGKEEIEKQSLVDLVDSLVLRIPEHCKNLMLTKLKTWKVNIDEEIKKELGFFGVNSSEMQNKLSASSKDIVESINKKGNDAEKSALHHYNFIAQQLGNQIKVHAKHKDIKIDGHKETDFDWKMIPFLPFILVALPFAMPFMRKGDFAKMQDEIQKFSAQVENMINSRTHDLELSLQSIKEKISKDLL
ncbi:MULTISPECIES: GTPase [Acinetobacter]|jgi:predicted GTPase|uniref:GTPase n=1 Tax=Acinetobacter TaxID=469 RepID=UPI001D185D4A|nr:MULTISPECIES: GTPase domain-containing protein [Acinetobacter]